jgi:hypothetical protein
MTTDIMEATYDIADKRRTAIDTGSFRAELARRRITARKFAHICGLGETAVYKVWSGESRGDPLTRVRLAQGLADLGIAPETIFVPVAQEE